MSNDRSGFPGMATAVTHLVWVVSGGVKVQSAATAPVGTSDTAPNKTAGIAPDRHIQRQLWTLIEFLLPFFRVFSGRIYLSICYKRATVSRRPDGIVT